MATINFDRRNSRIKTWGKDNLLRIKVKGAALGITHRSDSPSSGASLPKVKDRYRTKDGTINQVSFRFPRQLIWTAKGAGKGRGGLKGSRWIDKYGNTQRTNPESFGKMGTGGRTAKDFFNSTLDAPSGVNELADIVAEETGDEIINKLFIK